MIIGIVDIGSNSVRLVVYEYRHAVWHLLFNEKSFCGLGSHLAETGQIAAESLSDTIIALRRFRSIAFAYGARLVAVGTEALRAASNGQLVLGALSDTLGVPVRLLTGEEEARFSAQGVIEAIPDAHGLFGDLGGASLELGYIHHQSIEQGISIPCGALRMTTTAPLFLKQQIQNFALSVPVQHFYAVGGSWRSLARYHQHQQKYAFDNPHYYTVATSELLPTLKVLQQTSGKRLAGVSKGRSATMPAAAMLLQTILEYYSIKQITFSACGLREGYLWHATNGLVSRLRDPVSAEIAAYSRDMGTLLADTDILHAWLPANIANATPWTWAACLLSDIAVHQDRDYRGASAVSLIIGAPWRMVSHQQRLFLAAVLCVRYEGSLDHAALQPYLPVLTGQQQQAALRLGLALRLAKGICGVRHTILQKTPLVVIDGQPMRLDFTDAHLCQTSSLIEKRLKALLSC